MNNKLLSLAVAGLLVLSSACTRENAAAVPDRGDHAYVLAGAKSTPAAMTSGANSDPLPGPNETYHELQTGERLYRVAKQYGTTLAWLVERNDLVSRPVPVGTQLIVPSR